ncbi:MAG: Na/Pi cotransporter family protein [Ruminococcaceae bacterium]|nr:Na/Pi cotransporter family protein [Oscillospiraceae bacterium]
MDIFDLLELIGGLCLFLFGMNYMGSSLERRAGNSLRNLLGKLTTNKFAGFMTGLAVTAVIQSSSATTVMVVGFVNSSLMTLGQAINVIMGANVGTTVTAWLLSLTGIESSNVFVSLLKPTSFTPVLALIGIIFTMFSKSDKKHDTGAILLGFATLMFGMDIMSGAVSGLKEVPEFQQMFIMFENPILGVLVGALLTAVIQSSSASVGILQALASTGQVTFSAAIPIIMGQNIGTCVTALISSVGTNKNARRAALVHLFFNIIGTTVLLTVFCVVKSMVDIALLNDSATAFGIAIAHTIFNVACTALMLPLGGLLEKLVCFLVPDSKEVEKKTQLDERLLMTPSIALERSRMLTDEMAQCTAQSLKDSISALSNYSRELSEKVRKAETQTDNYEDVIGSFLVKLSSAPISVDDSVEAAMLLKVIGDFERISDHARNIIGSADELNEKNIHFSDKAKSELSIISNAVLEVMELSITSFINNDASLALQVECLEEVVDNLKEEMRTNHTRRLQKGECNLEIGFIWSDLLTNFERVSDHCSNIAGAVVDLHHHDMNTHQSLKSLRHKNEEFDELYDDYKKKYSLA